MTHPRYDANIMAKYRGCFFLDLPINSRQNKTAGHLQEDVQLLYPERYELLVIYSIVEGRGIILRLSVLLQGLQSLAFLLVRLHH